MCLVLAGRLSHDGESMLLRKEECLMKNKPLLNLQNLQNAYSSLCGLTILITDDADERLTEPSGLSEIAGLLLNYQSSSAGDSIIMIIEKVKGIQKPIVYETFSGFKLLIAPIKIREHTPYYIVAGALVDEGSKDLIVGRICDSIPARDWDIWLRALDATPTYGQDSVRTLLSRLEELADNIGVLLEREQEEENYAYKLQLLNLVHLMDPVSPNWLEGVLGIFTRVLGLEFAGYACNETAEEQYTIIDTVGIKAENTLRGASFSLGEGFLGQAALSRQMGYWERSDRDPRISFFTANGVKPRVIICYPLKYKNQLLGLLFGGDSSRLEISEEQADMGMLLAHQVASALYCLEMEASLERRRIRIETYKELAQALVTVRETEPFLQMLVDSTQQQVGSSFTCLLIHEPNDAGISLYAASAGASELYSSYAAEVESSLRESRPVFNRLQRPVQREWRGMKLIEFPLVLEQRTLGLLVVQSVDERKSKEYTTFLSTISILVITKLQLEAPQAPAGKTEVIGLLHDTLLSWKPEAHQKGLRIKELAQGLMKELNRSSEELEWVGQASLLTELDFDLLHSFFGDTSVMGILRQLQLYKTGNLGEEDIGTSSYSFLGKILLMVSWYVEKGEESWRSTLPIPVNETLLRSAEVFLTAESAYISEPLNEYKGNLTSREEEILSHVLLGLNNKEIAEKLYISSHTVKNHITKIYEKLGVNGRAQAISQSYKRQ